MERREVSEEREREREVERRANLDVENEESVPRSSKHEFDDFLC